MVLRFCRKAILGVPHSLVARVSHENVRHPHTTKSLEDKKTCICFRNDAVMNRAVQMDAGMSFTVGISNMCYFQGVRPT